MLERFTLKAATVHAPLQPCRARPASPPARCNGCSSHVLPRSLLIIRICLFMAYVWLLINAVTGLPAWPDVDNPGYLAVDSLVWSILNLIVHGAAMWQVRVLVGCPARLPHPACRADATGAAQLQRHVPACLQCQLECH